MVEYIVVYWTPSEKVFNYKHFEGHENSVGYARQKKKERFDVIIVKNINGKYHLMDYEYSTIYTWQNRILNFLSIMLVAIISYLYFKFFHQK
jgi:hypothetical protein